MIKYICDKCNAELPNELDRYTKIVGNDDHVIRTYLFCRKCNNAFWEYVCLFTKKDEEVTNE